MITADQLVINLFWRKKSTAPLLLERLEFRREGGRQYFFRAASEFYGAEHVATRSSSWRRAITIRNAATSFHRNAFDVHPICNNMTKFEK